MTDISEYAWEGDILGVEPSNLESGKRYTLWTRMPSGHFILERSYQGHYIKTFGDEILASRKSTRVQCVFPQGHNPNEA